MQCAGCNHRPHDAENCQEDIIERVGVDEWVCECATGCAHPDADFNERGNLWCRDCASEYDRDGGLVSREGVA